MTNTKQILDKMHVEDIIYHLMIERRQEIFIADYSTLEDLQTIIAENTGNLTEDDLEVMSQKVLVSLHKNEVVTSSANEHMDIAIHDIIDKLN